MPTNITTNTAPMSERMSDSTIQYLEYGFAVVLIIIAVLCFKYIRTSR